MKLKKWLLGLVTFAAMAVLCAVCVGAETYGDFNYSVLDDGTVEITKYIGSAEKVDIPAEIDGKSVTSIDSYTFSGCTNLTSITIPNSVTSIGDYAFLDCTSLKSITIPASVTYIGDGAIGYYVDKINWIYNRITGFEIKYTKNTYGHWYATKNGFSDESCSITNELADGTLAIKYAGRDKTYVIPAEIDGKRVTKIDYAAFSYCDNLESITIPDSVTSIDYSAFRGCSKLTRITIQDSETYIDERAY